MSPGKMHNSYSQPRTYRVPQQVAPPPTSSYYNPYNTITATYQTVPAWNRQPAADTGFGYPLNMPNISNLTNKALVDALLAPSVNEYEQGCRSFPFSTSSNQPPVPQTKGHRPSGEPLSESPRLGEQDYPAQLAKQLQTISEKRPRKQLKRKSTALSESDDEYVEGAEAGELHSPQSTHRPRRSSRPKRSPVPTGFPSPEEDDFVSPTKEKRSKKATPVKRASKARTGRLIRKKPVGTAVPKSLSEAGPADRMMWEWKNQGKNWEEIRSEWKKITGVEPGGSSLSVRYIKLVENLARNGAAGDIELLRFKKEAEDELMSHLWFKVAEKMLAYNPESEHNPKDLQKRYNMIVRSGYDVEKLLADDETKRSFEQKHRSPIVKNTEYEDEFEMDLDGLTTYDDPVANETAARIREHEIQFTNRRKIQPHFIGELPAVPEGSTSIFDSAGALRDDANGLNDQETTDNVKYYGQGRQELGNLMSNAEFLTTSPFTGHKDAAYKTTGTCLPLTSTLVEYNTDSE